ncbi:hypothetical protein CDV31_016175 [Fusarium ambrosium]|uniref:Uncharacterized protein n=1 Tax=Fusarium ambrosium TaxID=131363 RepID=A0A428SDP2_9HYPO|nr:hypothetical protein CDV31_016175 [Fusarium ambrosium]
MPGPAARIYEICSKPSHSAGTPVDGRPGWLVGKSSESDWTARGRDPLVAGSLYLNSHVAVVLGTFSLLLGESLSIF